MVKMRCFTGLECLVILFLTAYSENQKSFQAWPPMTTIAQSESCCRYSLNITKKSNSIIPEINANNMDKFCQNSKPRCCQEKLVSLEEDLSEFPSNLKENCSLGCQGQHCSTLLCKLDGRYEDKCEQTTEAFSDDSTPGITLESAGEYIDGVITTKDAPSGTITAASVPLSVISTSTPTTEISTYPTTPSTNQKWIHETTKMSLQTDASVGTDVTGAVVGTLCAVIAATGIVLFILWWRRRKREARGRADAVISTSGPPEVQGIANAAFRRSDEPNGSAAKHNDVLGRSNTSNEHVYTHIDSVTNLRPTSELQAGDESMYSELDDVTDWKQPSAPAPDDSYSLAHDPDNLPPKETTQTSASVYSLAHNPDIESASPKYFILEEEEKVSSADDKAKGGQYFVLEEGAADGETEGKKAMGSEGAVTIHGGHEYLSLASTGRADNRDDQGADYTPLTKTSRDEEAAQTFHGQEQNKEGQYFFLEEDAAKDGGDQGKGGQYFILEEDAADKDDKQGKNGQYFILEEEDANENKGQQQGVQYFVLEEGVAAVGDNQGDAADPGRDYSHLNPADMGDNSSDINKEYTPLGFVSKGEPAEKPVTTNNEYFELESEYSLQKQV